MPRANTQEAVTGVAALPVSVVGPLEISIGDYELEEPIGKVVETGRALERVHIPFAHTGEDPPPSLDGNFRTYVLRDRTIRASCFFCKSMDEAVSLARFLEAHVAELRRWLLERTEDARLRELETRVAGPICHVLWAFTTGDACGPGPTTRGVRALSEGFVLEHAPARPERATVGAASGGKTVVAECTLGETAHDLFGRPWAGATPAVAAIFAATGQELGAIATSSTAEFAAHLVEGGISCSIRLPGLQLGTVGGVTALPDFASRLELMGCAGAGKTYRLAQIVAAAALALEVGR